MISISLKLWFQFMTSISLKLCLLLLPMFHCLCLTQKVLCPARNVYVPRKCHLLSSRLCLTVLCPARNVVYVPQKCLHLMCQLSKMCFLSFVQLCVYFCLCMAMMFLVDLAGLCTVLLRMSSLPVSGRNMFIFLLDSEFIVVTFSMCSLPCLSIHPVSMNMLQSINGNLILLSSSVFFRSFTVLK